MLRSMTAFARQETEAEWGGMAWELRTVNHRYLEVTVRLPEEMRVLEGRIRSQAARSLKRGKLDCNLRLKLNPQQREALQLDDNLLDQLLIAGRRLAGRIGDAAPLNALELLRWPGVVLEKQLDLEPVRTTAIHLFEQALAELVESREREGAQLQQLLSDRLAAMQPLVDKVRQRLPEVRVRIREKLSQRIEEICQQPDQDRLEQELLYITQKMDVAEELDRLDSHLAEARRVLQLDEPVGRRLDFLMQEFNREANTLASKSADKVTTQLAVEIKVLIEQMREQVQNIE